MKRILAIITVLVTFAVPTACMAAPPGMGAYVSGFIGINIPTDTDVRSTDLSSAPSSSFTDRVKFNPSINIGGTGGYDFGYIRLEGELSYKHADISAISEKSPNALPFSNVDGSVGALAMMFNTFVDLHNSTPVTPYFGGGIGLAALHLYDTFGTNPVTGVRSKLYTKDDDTVFAYQVGAGVEIALNRRLSLDVGYRYFGTDTANFDRELIATNLKMESHTVAVGVRVKF